MVNFLQKKIIKIKFNRLIMVQILTLFIVSLFFVHCKEKRDLLIFKINKSISSLPADEIEIVNNGNSVGYGKIKVI